MTFVVKENDSVTLPDVVSLPPAWFETEGKNRHYVRLAVGKHLLSLKAKKREGAAGNQVWVKPGLLQPIDADKEIRIVGISKTQFKIDRLFRTSGGRFDVLGLLLILSGLIIQISFLFGDGVYAFWTSSFETKSFLNRLGSCLSACGVLVFVMRRLWFSTE